MSTKSFTTPRPTVPGHREVTCLCLSSFGSHQEMLSYINERGVFLNKCIYKPKPYTLVPLENSRFTIYLLENDECRDYWEQNCDTVPTDSVGPATVRSGRSSISTDGDPIVDARQLKREEDKLKAFAVKKEEMDLKKARVALAYPGRTTPDGIKGISVFPVAKKEEKKERETNEVQSSGRKAPVSVPPASSALHAAATAAAVPTLERVSPTPVVHSAIYPSVSALKETKKLSKVKSFLRDHPYSVKCVALAVLVAIIVIATAQPACSRSRENDVRATCRLWQNCENRVQTEAVPCHIIDTATFIVLQVIGDVLTKVWNAVVEKLATVGIVYTSLKIITMAIEDPKAAASVAASLVKFIKPFVRIFCNRRMTTNTR